LIAMVLGTASPMSTLISQCLQGWIYHSRSWVILTFALLIVHGNWVGSNGAWMASTEGNRDESWIIIWYAIVVIFNVKNQLSTGDSHL
jgi:hypothetical protein